MDVNEHSDPVLPQVRKWIEDCSGLIQEGLTFQQYLQDGTVLCKLMEAIRPGLIKRVNYTKSPFAWRENGVFFLEACKKLGLKGAQLCKPEDLIVSNSAAIDTQKHFRNVVVTLYWLGKTVKTFPWYTGPAIQLATDEVNFETQPQNFRNSNTKEVILQCTNDSSLCSEAITKPLHSVSNLSKTESVSPKSLYIEAAPLFSDSASSKTQLSESALPQTLCAKILTSGTLYSESPAPKTQISETSAPKEKHQHKTTVLIKVKQGQNLNNPGHKLTSSVVVDTLLLDKEELHTLEQEGSVDKLDKQPLNEVVETLNSTLLQTGKTSDHLGQSVEHSYLTEECGGSSDQLYLEDKAAYKSTVNSELPFGEPVVQINVPKNFSEQSSLDSELSLALNDMTSMQNMFGTDQTSSRGHDLFLSDVKSTPQTVVQGGQENTVNSVQMDIEIFLAPSDKQLGITLVPRGSGMHSQVESIAQGSPASCSQLKVGDEIVSVNSVPVTVGEETSEKIKKAAAEGRVLIGIKRLQSVSTSSLKLMVDNKNLSASKLQGLDLSRVRSDALPQGMLPKMVHCTSKTQSIASLNSPEYVSVPSNITSEVRSVDGSDKLSEKDIHLSNPSMFGSTDSYLGNLDAVNVPMLARADTPLLDGIMEIVRKNSSLSAAVDLSSTQMHSSDFTKHSNVELESQDLTHKTGHATNADGSSIEPVHDICNEGVLPHPQQHSTPLKHGSEYGDTVSPHVQSSSTSPMHNRGIEELLISLRELNEKVGTYDEEDEFKLLEEMLKSSSFKKAKEFHDRMLEIVSDKVLPVLKRATPVSQSIRRHLLYSADDNNALINELRALLRNPNIQAVLFCHDKVSTKDLYIPGAYFPRSAQDPVDIIHSSSDYNILKPTVVNVDAPLSRDVPSGRKENASIIFARRTNRPLGISVYKQENAVYIGRILESDRIENLVEGDELLEINGISIIHKATSDVMKLLACEPGETLALTIIPVHDDIADTAACDAKYVRAHFSFVAALDDELPCKPLGLSFQKGDILEISNQDDPNWWQARRIFEDGGESLPGLIPARHLMQKREALRIRHHISPTAEGKKGLMSVFTKRKKKKIFYHQGSKSDYSAVGDEVVTYEDVIKLSPDPERKRPIVLVGAPGVGKKTLIHQLLKLEPGHFSECIQHTTRPIHPDEINGREYYFINKEDMDRDICLESFLEFIEQGGFMYGTAYNTVKRIMESKYIPILQLHPQTLKKIRNSGLMPYIIFICSPSLERLQISRKQTPERSKRLISPSGTEELRSFTASKLQSLVEISCTIENQYGHYFDWTIVNDDLQVATDMLREVTKRVEEAVQWIPATWIQDC